MEKMLNLYDRSRVTCDWECPRKRYWRYEYENRGVVSGNTSLYLYLGQALHDGLAAIANQMANGMTIDEIGRAAFVQVSEAISAQQEGIIETEFAEEQGTLIEGLLRGFYRYAWPSLISRYPNILYVEKEMVYGHNGLTFMSKPDLVLANDEGNAVYVEYKSTSSKRDNWVESWNTAVQLHSSVKAIEATTGVKVGSVIVQGLYKGYVAYKRQNSPFCYGYFKAGNPPFTKDDTLYEYKAGYKKIPTWTMDGGVKKWVEGMPDKVLAEQFPQTPPIFLKDDLIDGFFEQRDVREHEIILANQMLEHTDDGGRKMLLNTCFEQYFDACQPFFGDSCEYRKICHGWVEMPLENGYQYREPHHALELEKWQENVDVSTSNQA